MAPIPEDLLNVSLEEVVFSAEWAPEVILPDPFPAFDSSQDDICEITPEKLLSPEKVLEPEKEKPVRERSMCFRSSAPGQSRKKKGTRKRRVWTQDMVEEGLRYSDQSDPESVEDGCFVRFNPRPDRSCLRLSFSSYFCQRTFLLFSRKFWLKIIFLKDIWLFILNLFK